MFFHCKLILFENEPPQVLKVSADKGQWLSELELETQLLEQGEYLPLR